MSLPLDQSSFQRDTSLDTLEKQLICPICLEVFTKPVVILPCQHNLCRKCANELYRVGIGGRFRCPSCRHDVVLDRHGVYGLQRNLLVENIIDVYKQESASSRPLPKQLTQITCEEHEGEKLNIYCISCQLPTCSLCKVFGAHSTCQVAPLTEVYQQQKDELNNGIGCLVATNERLQACINDLEELCRNIEENSRNQKEILCEKFDRLSAILDERRKIMVQEITDEQDEKTGWARSLVQTYSEHVDTNSKLVQTAMNTIEESEMAAFLQASKSLIERVCVATNCAPEETIIPEYENMDHYKVDFDTEEMALYQLDFLQPEEEIEETLEEPEPQSESELVLETEPEEEPEAEQLNFAGESPVPDQDLKSDSLPISTIVSDTSEDTLAQAATIKEVLCEKSGWSNTQDQLELGCKEHDVRGLEKQSFHVQADEEPKLYPSWYRPRQILSLDLALPYDATGDCDLPPLLVKEHTDPSAFLQSQTPLSMWMSGSLMPLAAKKKFSLEKSPFGRNSVDSPQDHMAEAEKDISESVSKDRVTSLSLQTAAAENSAEEPSSQPVTTESTRLSFSFSWLNPLAKKK